MDRVLIFFFLAAFVSIVGAQDALEPGEKLTYSAKYMVLDADICDDIVNTATAKAEGPCSSSLEEDDTVKVSTSYNADVDFKKMSDKSGEKVDLNDVITYIYYVENTGDVSLAIESIVDDMLGPIDIQYPSGDINNDGRLNPSEVWTYTASYEVQEDDLCSKIANRAILNALDPCKKPVYSAPAYAEVETTCNEWICTCCDSGTNWDSIDIGNQNALSMHNSEAMNNVNIMADQKGGRDCRAMNGAKIITDQRKEN